MMLNYYESGRIEEASLGQNFKFACAKITRLYPLHLVTMLIAMPFALNGIKMSGANSLLIKVLTNITLLQSFVPHSAIYYSLNAVAWYLSVCIFCYFCFPWILKKCEKYNTTRAFAIKGIVVLFLVQTLLSFLASKVNFSNSDGITKWFVYVFPIIRLIDFISGCLLGVLYIKRGNDKKLLLLRNGLFLSVVMIVIACIVYTSVNPDDVDLNHPELWWRYAVLFLIPNVTFIYALATNKENILIKVLSTKPLIFIGDLSASAFLIHQIAIRYCNAGAHVAGLDDTMWEIAYKMIIPFLITIGTCLIWENVIAKIHINH